MRVVLCFIIFFFTFKRGIVSFFVLEEAYSELSSPQEDPIYCDSLKARRFYFYGLYLYRRCTFSSASKKKEKKVHYIKKYKVHYNQLLERIYVNPLLLNGFRLALHSAAAASFRFTVELWLNNNNDNSGVK